MTRPTRDLMVAALLAVFPLSIQAQDFNLRKILVEEGFMSSQPSNVEHFWLGYLCQGGWFVDCQFTIELLRLPGDHSRIAKATIIDDKQITSADALIAKVSQAVPGISFVRNRRDPKIVHVIDERLKQFPAYALEKQCNVTYSGVLGDLSWNVEKQLGNIGPSTGGLIGEQFDDHVTRVSVNAKNEKLRDILTDCVPTAIYGPRLWLATTRKIDNNVKTTLQYYGPDLEKAVFWKEYVVAKAAKLNCYLTMERTWPTDVESEPTQWTPLGVAYLARRQEVSTIEDLVELLRRDIAGIKVFRDAGNPSVIHLVEDSLLKIPNYLMERRITIRYAGVLGELGAAIEEKYPDLGLIDGSGRKGDEVTAVDVDFENQTLRDTLTRSVPLDGYQRLLWETITFEKDGRHRTTVQFSGRQTSGRESR